MKNEQEIILRGIPLSDGAAVAPVCIFNDTAGQDIPVFNISLDKIGYEKDRLGKAFEKAWETVDRLKSRAASRLSEAEAAIFDVHLMMLRDSSLLEKMRELVEVRHLNAEAAVSEVMNQHRKTLAASENEYMRDRADDITALIKAAIINPPTIGLFKCKIVSGKAISGSISGK